MLWSIRKHPLDKTEFIAPMDAYLSQKSISILQVFETLYLKTLYLNIKALSNIILKYCSCTVM